MTTPVKRIAAKLQNHVEAIGKDAEGYALDDMASHNLCGLFSTLFEIDQRIKSERENHDRPVPDQ